MPIAATSEAIAARDTLIRQHYPAGDLHALAQQLGITVNRLQNVASQLGVKRMVRERTQRICDQILKLASTPRGVSIVEAATTLNLPYTAVENAASRLVTAGQLHKARIAHRTVRLCLTAEAANRLVAHTARPRRPSHTAMPQAVAIAGRPGDTVQVNHARGPAHLPGEPQTTPHTKYTIAEPPKASLRSNTHLFSA